MKRGPGAWPTTLASAFGTTPYMGSMAHQGTENPGAIQQAGHEQSSHSRASGHRPLYRIRQVFLKSVFGTPAARGGLLGRTLWSHHRPLTAAVVACCRELCGKPGRFLCGGSVKKRWLSPSTTNIILLL